MPDGMSGCPDCCTHLSCVPVYNRLGMLFPKAGNRVPDVWDPDSQPVGNSLHKGDYGISRDESP